MTEGDGNSRERYADDDEVNVSKLVSEIVRLGGVEEDSNFEPFDPNGSRMQVEILLPADSSQQMTGLQREVESDSDLLEVLDATSGIDPVSELQHIRRGPVPETALGASHLLAMATTDPGGKLRVRPLQRPTSESKLEAQLEAVFPRPSRSDGEDCVEKKIRLVEDLHAHLEEAKGDSTDDRKIYEFFRILFIDGTNPEILRAIIKHCFEVDDNNIKLKTLLVSQLNLMRAMTDALSKNERLLKELKSAYVQLAQDPISDEANIPSSVLALYFCDSEVIKGFLIRAKELRTELV